MAKTVIQKNWYEIQAPDIFSKDVISETPADEESKVIGRTVSEDLTELMNDTSKYYVDVSMKITDVEGNKAFTEIDGMECSNEFVSRMVRKRSDRMDLVHDVTTADDREVRIKIVGATVRNASSRVLSDVRNSLKEVLDEKASTQAYNELMENIFTDRTQEDLRDVANEIYPFRQLEVRKTELLD